MAPDASSPVTVLAMPSEDATVRLLLARSLTVEAHVGPTSSLAGILLQRLGLQKLTEVTSGRFLPRFCNALKSEDFLQAGILQTKNLLPP